jgi:hypothetical protein
MRISLNANAPRPHIVHLQQRFQLKDVGDLLRFFGDFELLVTAIGYYRRSFAGLAPHMRQLDVNVRALSPPDDRMTATATMLATVSAHLNHAVTKIEQSFDSFDASFDDILSSAQPQTFKRLQESLQRAYGRIGALLCGWGAAASGRGGLHAAAAHASQGASSDRHDPRGRLQAPGPERSQFPRDRRCNPLSA